MAIKRRQLSPEEKAEKKAKARARREENEKKETVTIDSKDQTFLDKNGEETKLMEFLRPEDIWEIETKRIEDHKVTITKRYFILYDAIKRLAKEAGIFYFDKTPVYVPSIENKDLYGFDVTVYCRAGLDNASPDGVSFCKHGFFKTTMLGEANSDNTKRLSEKYKGLTAEKRGYVRAVIAHLGLRNIYGEDELEEEVSERTGDRQLKGPEFEALREILNKILNCKDKEELTILGSLIASESENYSKPQLEYLRKVYQNKLSSLEGTGF